MHLDASWSLGERDNASEHWIVRVAYENDRFLHDSFPMFRLIQKRPRHTRVVDLGGVTRDVDLDPSHDGRQPAAAWSRR